MMDWVFSNRCKHTLLDKMISLLALIEINQPYYFVADAYYASGKVIKGLSEDNHLITGPSPTRLPTNPLSKKGARKTAADPKRTGTKFCSNHCLMTCKP